MQHHGTNAELEAPATVTVLPTDTLLCALRRMQEHRICLLPVVEETGALLGLISEAHILEAWDEDPLRILASSSRTAWSVLPFFPVHKSRLDRVPAQHACGPRPPSGDFKEAFCRQSV